jgi:hypothetical protein
MSESSLADRQGAALAELERWRPDLEPLLAKLSPAVPFDAVREQFVAILPKMPDPGWRATTMRAFSTGGAVYVAVYLALRPMTPAEVWSLCDAATRSHFGRMKGMERSAASAGMFSWPMKWLTRSLDARSKEAPVGGWVASFVPPADGTDYGVDYHRCAIHHLAIDADAAEFAPFICNSDAVGSEEFGWGLSRTTTLAQGGTRCDFRFTKGAPTKVKLHVVREGSD